MIDINGRWHPKLSPRQIDVYNDPRRHILLSGPRICGKSIVAVHRMIKHAWLYANDRVGIFVKSTRVGKSGVWSDIIDYALPEWCDGMEEAGFKITTPPSCDGATRMHYIRIANRHGGESEIQLHSLHNDESVLEKLKGTRFGAMLWDELDNYSDPAVYQVSVLQLRQIGLAHEKHLWLATTNPAGDDSHWIFQKFFVDPSDPTLDQSYRDSIAAYKFKLTDNVFLSDAEISTLKMTYKNDPEMFRRYVEGEWVPDLRRSHFAGAFFPSTHIKGDLVAGTSIVPTDSCQEIVCGWDPGDRNSAVIMLEHVTTMTGDYWAVLDEVVHIGEDLPLKTLTEEVMGTMQNLTTVHGKPLKFKQWSDSSAFNRYRSAADARDSLLVYQYSDRKIELLECPKPPNSVDARISLVRKLLLANKLFVSSHCTRTIDMLKRLSKGKTKTEKIRRDAHGDCHVFDALSYALFGELIDSIELGFKPKIIERAAAFALCG